MQPEAFEPEAIAAMSEAFDDACESQPEVMREVARRIIAAARFGERSDSFARSRAPQTRLAGRWCGRAGRGAPGAMAFDRCVRNVAHPGTLDSV
jgi:hypothetical protein